MKDMIQEDVLTSDWKVDSVKTDDFLTVGDLEISRDFRKASWKGTPIKLSKTEHPFLLALVSSAGQQIRREVFEDIRKRVGLRPSDRAVDLTIKRLRRKIIKIDPQFNFISVVYGIGYRWSEVPPGPGYNLKKQTDTHVDLIIDPEELQVTLDGKYIKLNKSQIRILAEMARCPRRYLRHDHIVCAGGLKKSNRIPHTYSEPSGNTIRLIRRAVRAVHPDIEIFEVAYGVGTRLHQQVSPQLKSVE